MKLNKQEILELIEQNGNRFLASQVAGVPKSTFYRWCDEYGISGSGVEECDAELVESNIKYKQETQKQRDLNRVANKTFREQARFDNATEALNQALINKINLINKSEAVKTKVIKRPDGNFGVVWLNDTHFGEGVDLDNNQYNWDVAGKRLKKFIDSSTQEFKNHNVKRVLFALGGDLINSDRRLDELLCNVDNRAAILIGAVNLINQAINDLKVNFFVSVLSVWGNESRRLPEIGFATPLASDNYDHTIYNMLRLNCAGHLNVEFLGEGLEILAEYGGVNLFFTHGHTYGNELEKAVAKIRAKYSAQGLTIDYLFSGHVHSSYLGPDFCRGGSLTGNNAYNFNALHINGRATQNAVVFFSKNNRIAYCFDLQETDGIGGYKIPEILHQYHTKSKAKTGSETTILKIVV